MISTGDLKSLGLLWTNLATTSYTRWIDPEDLKTFGHRLDNEGLSFLTVVLPTIGKALDNFHSTGEWVAPPDFKCRVPAAGFWLAWPSRGYSSSEPVFVPVGQRPIPKFMGYVVDMALNGDSSAVDCVRQLSYMFYKLEVNYDEKTKQQFLDKFIKTDLALADAIDFKDAFTSKLVAEMRRMVHEILCNEDPSDIRPCHGGGATACHTSNSEKWHKLRYYPKLDAVFPYSDYFYYSATHLVDELGRLEASQELVPKARVCLVPKDSRGPRIISCEPAELLYIQQGLMRKLYRCLEASPITAGQLNFTDQGVNQLRAKCASITGYSATIDLSDASDRVAWALVERIFPPRWVEALEACRSEETVLPDGRSVKLKKFAPMGSSCCFPVEALTFFACLQATWRMERRVSISTRADGEEFRTYGVAPKTIDTFVYGDDIIVPSHFYEEAVNALTKIGLVVNLSKSFARGPFRESCGGEYHLGIDVTPVRIRKVPSRQGSGLAASAELANNFIRKFGEDKALPLIRVIEEQIGYIFPRSPLGLPGTIYGETNASNDAFFRRRWNTAFQRFEHRVLTLSSTNQQVHPPNWEELLRKELSRDVAVSGKYTHPLAIADSVLEPGYYTDSHSVHTKWQWVWLG
jgi:hypothetical protein